MCMFKTCAYKFPSTTYSELRINILLFRFILTCVFLKLQHVYKFSQKLSAAGTAGIMEAYISKYPLHWANHKRLLYIVAIVGSIKI